MNKYIEQLVDWDCGRCGESNTDIPDQTTHCVGCGRVHLIGKDESMVFDEGWNVDPREGRSDDE